MNLQDAIALIKNDEIGIKESAQWADLGCGSGLFTYALANLLQKGSDIHAVDKSPITLEKLPNPNHINIFTKQVDFVHHALPAANLDGILMANSLHFVSNKPHFIANVEKQLTDGGVFLVVEYDITESNPWVPHPINRQGLEEMFKKSGYSSFTPLHEVPSLYHTGNIYSALIKK